MKKDIKSAADIELLVNSFYDKVRINPVIGYIFNDLAKVDWEKHLPVMYRFWENALFYTGGYFGNPMKVHKHLDRLFPLSAVHFEEWNKLFAETVDELFIGETATLAKERALRISALMQLEIIKKPSDSKPG